jgi:hypothetical protein
VLKFPVGGHQNQKTAMASLAADLIVLDTLGKLYTRGHGLNGDCRPCPRTFSAPGRSSK